MDKKKLKPGRYLANVVASGTTSRVVFVVEDPSGKLKIPSIQQLVDFLQKVVALHDNFLDLKKSMCFVYFPLQIS